MSGMGRSTLWRHVANGVLRKGHEDARGRATLLLDDVLAAMDEHLGLAWGPDDLAVLQRADAGAATAQAELGAWLYVAWESGSRGGGGRRIPARFARGGTVLAAAERGPGRCRGHALAGAGGGGPS